MPDGVVTADGATRQADVIIYGTGFKTLDFLAPMSVTGFGGRRLDNTWRDGAEAYLGISVSGFPNFFMLYGPNTNLGGNSIIYMLEGQISYVLGAIQALEADGLDWIDVRPEVQDTFNAWVDSGQPHLGVGERVPQLVHDRFWTQHQQLARSHFLVPAPRPPLRSLPIPGHAGAAGAGRG